MKSVTNRSVIPALAAFAMLWIGALGAQAGSINGGPIPCSDYYDGKSLKGCLKGVQLCRRDIRAGPWKRSCERFCNAIGGQEDCVESCKGLQEICKYSSAHQPTTARQPTARISIQACSSRDRRLNVAYAVPVGNGRYRARGWFVLPPKRCIQLPSSSRHETHYFFAFEVGSNLYSPKHGTPGAHPLCLGGLQAPFEIQQTLNVRCAAGQFRRDMWPMPVTNGSIRAVFN